MIIKTPKYSLLIFLSTIWLFSYTAFCQRVDVSLIEGIKLPNGNKSLCTKIFNLSFSVSSDSELFSEIKNFTYRVQLSDSTGEFGQNTLTLRTGGELQRGLFNYVVENLELKGNLFGEKYRFRIEVLNDKGEVVSRGLSESYGVYNVEFTKAGMVLNNSNETVVSCEEKTIKLTVEIKNGQGKDIANNYERNIIWYRRLLGETTASIIKNKRGKTIEVNQAGEYNAALETRCVSSLRYSNKVTVKYEKIPEVSIKGSNVIKICEEDKSPQLQAEPKQEGYRYQWLKFNGNDNRYEEIEGATGATYKPQGKERKGFYKVKLVASGDDSCFSLSEYVEIKEVKSTDFDLDVNVPSTTVLLPGETKKIEAVYSLESSDVCWYSKTDASFKVCERVASITKPGVYYAEVKDKSLSCGRTKKTKEITVLLVKSIKLNVKANSYTECESSNTELQIDKLKAVATDDNTYDLSTSQFQQFTYYWYKDEKQIKEGGYIEYTVSSYKENGTYYLEAVFNGSGKFKAQSNKIDIKLTAEKPNVQSSSKTNTICKGSSIIFSFTNVVEGFTYKWYKDDKPLSVTDPKKITVKEIGVYRLEVEGNGCNSSQIIEVKPFDENAIKTTPKDKLILYPNSKGKIVAEGGDTYEWYNENKELVSTTNTLETDEEGIYTLKVKSGICEAIKKIEVVVDEGGSVVQTIVSPNDDGINDTWAIPNKYAYQPNVLINIYNANGKLIYTTKSYKNDWPLESIDNQKIFYYQIIRDNKPIKSGTISVID